MVLKHYLQRTPWNNLYNFWLQLRAWRLSKKEVTGERKALPPSGYELVFSDDFKSDSLDLDEWRYGHPWGFFHPEQLYWYWTKEATENTQDGLVLKNRYLPKTIYKKDLPSWQQKPELPDEFTLPWASGLISSKKVFRFGWIEAEIKLPKEEMQWSAFWTSGDRTWPPEIDIFEAYTDQDPLKVSLRPNVHWGDTSGKWTKKDYGAPLIPVSTPTDRFVQYAVHWTEKFIKIYFDGKLVQVCRNRAMLKKNSAGQYIIINNGLKEPTKDHSPTEGSMVVRNLKVFQKKS